MRLSYMFLNCQRRVQFNYIRISSSINICSTWNLTNLNGFNNVNSIKLSRCYSSRNLTNKQAKERYMLKQTGKTNYGKKKKKGRRILDDVEDIDIEGMLGGFDFDEMKDQMKSSIHEPLDEDERNFLRDLPQEVKDFEKLPIEKQEEFLDESMKDAEPGSFAEINKMTQESGEQEEMIREAMKMKKRMKKNKKNAKKTKQQTAEMRKQQDAKTEKKQHAFIKQKMKEMKETGEYVPNLATSKTKEIIFQPDRLGFTNAGWDIQAVASGTQAEKLGVKVGWTITSVNGNPMFDDTNKITKAISKTRDHGKATKIEFSYSHEGLNVSSIPNFENKNLNNLKNRTPKSEMPPDDDSKIDDWLESVPEVIPDDSPRPNASDIRTLDDHSTEFFAKAGIDHSPDLEELSEEEYPDEHSVDNYMDRIPDDALSEQDHKDRAMCKRFLHEGNTRGLHKAAHGGSRFAQGFLGFLHMTGVMNGIKRDDVKARIWVERAARQGDWEAQCHAGNFCFNGEGGPQDLQLARDYWANGAKNGHSGCMVGYGQFLLNGFHDQEDVDIPRGMQWLTKAAYDGHAEAALQLAQIYMEDVHVPQDMQQGTYWYHEAQKLDPNIQKMVENAGMQDE